MKNFIKSKLCFCIIIICLICTGFVVVHALSSVTLYNEQQNQILVNKFKLEKYLEKGWFTEPVVKMYDINGMVTIVKHTDKEIYKTNGWYEEPVLVMYNIEGNTAVVKKAEKQYYKTNGWYEEPVILVYAPDGRINIIKQSEIELYINAGWFLSQEEARFSLVNKRELELLARTIHAEAADNNYIDRCYAGMVVMNRKNSGIWGNSIESVISAPGQYSCYKNRKFNSAIPEECYEIAKQIMLGETFGVPYNVIFQSSSSQGTGIWKIVYNTTGYNNYYCYGNI